MKKYIIIILLSIIYCMPMFAWQSVSLGTALDFADVESLTMTAGTIFAGTGMATDTNYAVYRCTGLSNPTLTMQQIATGPHEINGVFDLKIDPNNQEHLWVSDFAWNNFYPHISIYNPVLSGPPFTRSTTPGVGYINYQIPIYGLNNSDRIPYSIVIDRTNSNHVLAGSNGFIGETFDYGVTWRVALPQKTGPILSVNV
jgi:hypothetical protein